MSATWAIRTGIVGATLAALIGCGLQPEVVQSGREPHAVPEVSATPEVSDTEPLAPVSPIASPTPSQSVTPTATSRPTSTPIPTPTARPTATTTVTPAPTSTPVPSPTTAPPRPQLPPDPARTLPGAPRGSRGVVYLTFDDGPSAYTRTYLGILSRFRATATFFQLGQNVTAFPALTAAIRAQGSSIGNHTHDHRDLTKLTKAEQRAEWLRGPQVRCGRPPYGATDAKVAKVMRKLHLRQVLWDVDTVDWSRPGAEIIYRRGAGAAVHRGSIVLMHDGGGERSQTVQALPRILTELYRRGYVVRKLPGC